MESCPPHQRISNISLVDSQGSISNQMIVRVTTHEVPDWYIPSLEQPNASMNMLQNERNDSETRHRASQQNDHVNHLRFNFQDFYKNIFFNLQYNSSGKNHRSTAQSFFNLCIACYDSLNNYRKRYDKKEYLIQELLSFRFKKKSSDCSTVHLLFNDFLHVNDRFKTGGGDTIYVSTLQKTNGWTHLLICIRNLFECYMTVKRGIYPSFREILKIIII